MRIQIQYMYLDCNFYAKGPFAFGENDTDFLCPQKWVAWLSMLLFTHGDEIK